MAMPKIKNIIAFALFITVLGIFIRLGFWQVERLAWKTDIINKLNNIYSSNVTDNLYQFEDLKLSDDQNIPILYGTIEGQFDYTKEILVGPKPYNNQVGYQVITPLKLKQGGIVLVSRGYISVHKKDKIEKTHIDQFIKISGLIRLPDWTKFTPKNSPENNVWSRLDIHEIAQAKGIKEIAPVMMYAEKSSINLPFLSLQEEKWLPRNKHRQYAIFWFTSAFILCGLFSYFIYSQRRR